MYDRGLSVLEQYGLKETAVYRGRGSLICKTEQGIFLIKEFSGRATKLESQALLLKAAGKDSGILTDEILVNQEGSYISTDGDNISYIVKRWYEGRECDTRNEGDICAGIKALASLHKTMHMPVQEHYVKEPLNEEFQRHNRELRKIRKFIYSKRKKNEFEQLFLNSIEVFLGYAQEALEQLEKSQYRELRNNMMQEGNVCHGEYNQHNILMLEGSRIAVTNFDKWNYDVPISDVYQFMRKILEKHDWDQHLGKKMLEAYNSVRPVCKEELENLTIRFAYPEKYWKLANYYYSHNKAWISQKNVEKMKKIIGQQRKWRDFVENLSV